MTSADDWVCRQLILVLGWYDPLDVSAAAVLCFKLLEGDIDLVVRDEVALDTNRELGVNGSTR